MPKDDIYDTAIEKIRTMLLCDKGLGIKQSEITHKLQTYLNANQIHMIMLVMHELGLVDKFITHNGKSTIYMANSNTKNFNLDALKEEVTKQI